jgi:hypothetical protein
MPEKDQQTNQARSTLGINVKLKGFYANRQPKSDALKFSESKVRYEK